VRSPTPLDVSILTVICPPVNALSGTCTSSRILDSRSHLSSEPPDSKNLEPRDCEPALTEVIYSLLLLKSVFTTSIVIRAPDASPEKTTSQDGADVEVLVHTLVEDDDEDSPAESPAESICT